MNVAIAEPIVDLPSTTRTEAANATTITPSTTTFSLPQNDAGNPAAVDATFTEPNIANNGSNDKSKHMNNESLIYSNDEGNHHTIIAPNLTETVSQAAAMTKTMPSQDLPEPNANKLAEGDNDLYDDNLCDDNSNPNKIELANLYNNNNNITNNGEYFYQNKQYHSGNGPSSSFEQQPTHTIAAPIVVPAVLFARYKSTFLRVADLHWHVSHHTQSKTHVATLEKSLSNTTDTSSAFSDESFPNFHFLAVDPPPNMPVDPLEKWIALDNGHGDAGPMAALAVKVLMETGQHHALNQALWKPVDRATIKAAANSTMSNNWYNHTWQPKKSVPDCRSWKDADTVYVWSGTFGHGLYGSDLPAVRAAGLVDISPLALLELLVDSSRVKEYNTLSLGRRDVLVLQDNMDANTDLGGVTKVCQSETKPPLVRKTLTFTSLLHARQWHSSDSYQMVTRAVTGPSNNNNSATAKTLASTSEILMGVTLLQAIENQPNKTLVITVNHVRSPLVPLMVAKRIGVSAAQNFFYDLRKYVATTHAKGKK